ncbi:hypothetical protein AVEN_33103-1 [Araneus ventricosus]|uniref:Uncharacterized protein n=1 Tax=Araneus ventricosus TaxID=182803 RepID=A0A4Y2CTN0_ARAVE|nr:hypothetical protein AVEN_33103-1 [Araneus ventricosus]
MNTDITCLFDAFPVKICIFASFIQRCKYPFFHLLQSFVAAFLRNLRIVAFMYILYPGIKSHGARSGNNLVVEVQECDILTRNLTQGGPPAGVIQKIPTLAQPTQKGCKAGRGTAGRAPPACGGRGLLGTIR